MRRVARSIAAAAVTVALCLVWACDLSAPDEQSCTSCSPPNLCRVSCQIDPNGGGECECFASCDPLPKDCAAANATCDCLEQHAIEVDPSYACSGDATSGFMLESKECTP
ncbi:MAG TPA: hypothetical protein VGM56_21440 [Byssovorax sp.]